MGKRYVRKHNRERFFLNNTIEEMSGKQVKKELRQRGNIRKRENAYC